LKAADTRFPCARAMALLMVLSAGACAQADDTAPSWQPWATTVISFEPGLEAGFGQDGLPVVVLGTPQGGNPESGTMDVVSLGHEGEITLAFDGPIVDGPGPDLIVFENVFFLNNTHDAVFAEPAEVAVSLDGQIWHTFPCTESPEGVWTGCAGLNPQASSASEWTLPLEPSLTGGDLFDLDAVALVHNPALE